MRGNHIGPAPADIERAAGFGLRGLTIPERPHGLRSAACHGCHRGRPLHSSTGCYSALLLFFSCVLGAATVSRAEVTIPARLEFVVDRAGIIDAGTKLRMENWLRELERKTTAQVKVLTVPTTEGEDISQFAQRHAELWKLGRKGKDNGALIALALQERHVKIQTGYGLEGTLPDSWCGSLSRKVAARYFKQGAYSQGLRQLTVAVANRIADEANVTLTGIPVYRYRARRVPGGGAACGGLFPLVIMLVIFSSMGRRSRHYGRWGGGGMMHGLLLGGLMGGMLGGGRSHWGGGGFGGGFGGGSFGGGGAFGGGGGGASW